MWKLRFLISVMAVGFTATMAFAEVEFLQLHHAAVDLPGPPSKVLATDVDQDGLSDLVVVFAFTELEAIGEDRIENMVQISTVIPALFERRELRVYLGRDDGSFVQAGEGVELPPSMLHLELGPPAVGLVAMADDGLLRLRFQGGAAEPVIAFEPLLESPSILAGTKSFFAELELVHDIDDDGIDDVMFPRVDGIAFHRGTPNGLQREPVSVVRLQPHVRGGLRRNGLTYPIPSVGDLNGDGRSDLLFRFGSHVPQPRVHIYLGDGGGRFRALRKDALDCHDRGTDLRFARVASGLQPWPENLSALRDLDGDGRAEAVITEARPRGDGFRKGLKDAKRPIKQMRFHRLDATLQIDPDPYFEMEVAGHSAAQLDEDDTPLDLEFFRDLDGDGLEDLAIVQLGFSVFQVLKVLTTKKIGIGLDYQIYTQQPDGDFKEVPQLDLSEKFKFNLNNLKLNRFGHFAGDFNGDGKQDFAHLGRGKLITLHAGQVGCRYSKKADMAIQLVEAPASLDLLRIEDLNGDGRSDLRVTRPLESTDPDVTPPVRVDIYLSRLPRDGGAE